MLSSQAGIVFLKEIGSIKIINEQRKVCGCQSEENCVEVAKGDADTVEVKINAEGLFPLGHGILETMFLLWRWVQTRGRTRTCHKLCQPSQRSAIKMPDNVRYLPQRH